MKKLLIIPALSFGLLSCEVKKNSEGLSISVSPEQVFVVPGTDESCQDAKTNVTATDPTRSIAGPRVRFTNFVLGWANPNHSLTVALIRVTLTGQGITGGEQKIDFAVDEIEALLGRTGGFIAAVSGNTEIQSINTKGSTGYLPCGLAVGGIALADPTAKFTARAKVELFGFSTNSAGEQEPVRAEIKAKIRSI